MYVLGRDENTSDRQSAWLLERGILDVEGDRQPSDNGYGLVMRWL
jgi:hypothetical protein